MHWSPFDPGINEVAIKVKTSTFHLLFWADESDVILKEYCVLVFCKDVLKYHTHTHQGNCLGPKSFVFAFIHTKVGWLKAFMIESAYFVVRTSTSWCETSIRRWTNWTPYPDTTHPTYGRVEATIQCMAWDNRPKMVSPSSFKVWKLMATRYPKTLFHNLGRHELEWELNNDFLLPLWKQTILSFPMRLFSSFSVLWLPR